MNNLPEINSIHYLDYDGKKAIAEVNGYRHGNIIIIVTPVTGNRLVDIVSPEWFYKHIVEKEINNE